MLTEEWIKRDPKKSWFLLRRSAFAPNSCSTIWLSGTSQQWQAHGKLAPLLLSTSMQEVQATNLKALNWGIACVIPSLAEEWPLRWEVTSAKSGPIWRLGSKASGSNLKSHRLSPTQSLRRCGQGSKHLPTLNKRRQWSKGYGEFLPIESSASYVSKGSGQLLSMPLMSQQQEPTCPMPQPQPVCPMKSRSSRE